MVEIGDFVKVIDKNIEGSVQLKNKGLLIINDFVQSELSEAEGVDIIAKCIKDDGNIKRIQMEDIHKQKYSNIFSIDIEWLKTKPTPGPPKKTHPTPLTQVFWPTNEQYSKIVKAYENTLRQIQGEKKFIDDFGKEVIDEFKMELEDWEDLFYDETNWKLAMDWDYLSYDVICFEMPGVHGLHEYCLSSNSWRIRDNLKEYILRKSSESPIKIQEALVKKRVSSNHKCSPKCIRELIRRTRANFTRDYRKNIPYEIPMNIFGFQRKEEKFEVLGDEKEHFRIFYVTPCGKKICSNRDLETWFIAVEMDPSDLGFINFDFSNRKLPSKLVVCLEGEEVVYDDLSGGRENFKIPVVSTVKCRPPKVGYPRTKHLPIPKYVDEEDYQKFMVCCDCNDGCQPLTCACMELTYEGFRSTTDFFQKSRGARSDLKNGLITKDKYEELCKQICTNVGYHDGIIQTNRKLTDDSGKQQSRGRSNAMTTSGVYECHKGCACHNKWCNNRVVQNGIKIPMVLYRTSFCGWGIRAMTDLKAGTYLGDYFGKVLFEASGIPWDKGKFYESDTAARLNFVEIAEDAKDSASKQRAEEQDDGFGDENDIRFSATRMLLHNFQGPVIPLTHKKRQEITNEFLLSAQIPIIDASEVGNLGRFFNHSCNPNIAIQNVFTDHHDIRYPNTSFFTLRNIKAGEELCWNYGYENKKSKECFCGTKQCNGFYA